MVAKKKRTLLIGKKLPILLVCIALITVGLVLLFFSLYAIFKVDVIKMTIQVSDRSAFNTDTEFINFGRAINGASSTRVLVISHSHTKPLLLHFKVSGNISQLVSAPDDFYLEPNLGKEVSITATVPMGAEKAKYEGELTVYFRRI